MEAKTPFSQEELNEIFKISPELPRESRRLFG